MLDPAAFGKMPFWEMRDQTRVDPCAGDFINVREDANSMVDEIDPRQPFLRVNILRWREIFRMIETPSSNVDLIGHFVVVLWRGKEAQFPCEVVGIHR